LKAGLDEGKEMAQSVIKMDECSEKLKEVVWAYLNSLAVACASSNGPEIGVILFGNLNVDIFWCSFGRRLLHALDDLD
jgi:hypothetical protein